MKQEKSKTYREKNLTKFKEYEARSREKRKEQNKLYSKEYYQKNKIKRNAITQKWKENNPDKNKISQQKSKSKCKDLAYEFSNFVKSYYGCNSCGIVDFRVLQFHHLNPKDKKRNIAHMVGTGYGIPKLKEEMKKCVVLCSNCHIILHCNYRQSQAESLMILVGF